MPEALLPLLVEPAELEAKLGAPDLLLVDLNRAEQYSQAHLPGAVRLEYADITAANPPATGLLPDTQRLSQVLGAIGLTPQKHVVAYDGDGGSRAARFLWTLEAVGHRNYSLLNGGIVAWQQEGRPQTRASVTTAPSPYRVNLRGDVVADKNWVLNHLDDPTVTIVDTRTPAEYHGSTVRAARGGHIPSALNFDYSNAIDSARQLRLRPAAELRAALSEVGIRPEQEVAVYCHTHNRSAHTWFVLKWLGFPRVRGYPGSWSEWGNSPDVPIE